ncbi:glycosyltransferase family 58 protein [Dendrothele bispora CBS 962.96]|uniref:Dol-P-Man:Man(5)GlcNAc(2)-PP-Dol alpha-1,3-mannosyltransferase n=1 Tax=Dendrothele bispora (strain CBS 962.96) TaxID=1314807 RepID=A0A4S8MQI3_DENBC|nr:glycosyltransferase family 58 protein [Dendrothele bispora CBS 962.96]
MRALSLSNIFQWIQQLLFDPKYFWLLSLAVVLGDAVLSELIIRFVPYTEIDWETYMIHIGLYRKGERNYANITGPTGPLVYPAGHVHIHNALYELTSSGTNVGLAQQIYALLYTASVALSCAIYGKAGSIPNWLLLVLPLSKRLHSIFTLRLFNDCWSLVFVQGAILAFQSGMDDMGSLLYSAALSVKMSALLYLPGLLVILVKRRGILFTCRKLITILAIQTFVAYPFVKEDLWTYINCAFDFGRVFLYKWTVNWRMVPEEIFLSQGWAKSLLIGHVTVLFCFGLFSWCKPDGGVFNIVERALRRPHRPAGLAPITPDYVATVLFTSNLIGILFARSLHYQFYSWYAQQVPFLVWKTKYPYIVRFCLILAIEYAWNVFPSTVLSSSVLLGSNATILLGLLLNAQ